LKRRSPEQALGREQEKKRKHQLALVNEERAKVESANQTTAVMMAQKHESFQRAADSLAKSFAKNPNVDPADPQAALAALAKNFGIIT
jgi:hypothetical protein